MDMQGHNRFSGGGGGGSPHFLTSSTEWADKQTNKNRKVVTFYWGACMGTQLFTNEWSNGHRVITDISGGGEGEHRHLPFFLPPPPPPQSASESGLRPFPLELINLIKPRKMSHHVVQDARCGWEIPFYEIAVKNVRDVRVYHVLQRTWTEHWESSLYNLHILFV